MRAAIGSLNHPRGAAVEWKLVVRLAFRKSSDYICEVGRASEGLEYGCLGRAQCKDDLLAIKDAGDQEVCTQLPSNLCIAFFHPAGSDCTLQDY